MFPLVPGYKAVDLTPAPLPKPVEVEFTFSGGPFDGHKSTATVRCKLDSRITVIMKKSEKRKYLYRYAGNNTFRYEKKA